MKDPLFLWNNIIYNAHIHTYYTHAKGLHNLFFSIQNFLINIFILCRNVMKIPSKFWDRTFLCVCKSGVCVGKFLKNNKIIVRGIIIRYSNYFQIYWAIKTDYDKNHQPIVTISYPFFPYFIWDTLVDRSSTWYSGV